MSKFVNIALVGFCLVVFASLNSADPQKPAAPAAAAPAAPARGNRPAAAGSPPPGPPPFCRQPANDPAVKKCCAALKALGPVKSGHPQQVPACQQCGAKCTAPPRGPPPKPAVGGVAHPPPAPAGKKV